MYDTELVTRQRTLDGLVSVSSFTAMTYELRPEYEPGWGEECSRRRECESQGPEQEEVNMFKEQKG